MMKGEVSDTVVLIGILVLVSLTILTSFATLNRVELPKEFEQEVSGSNQTVSADLSRLADSCWRKSGQGQSSEKLDCFNVKVRSNGSLNEGMIGEKLEILDRNSFGLTDPVVPDGESSLQITYHPGDKTVNITVINSCSPSTGDTCYSVECSCETVCGPGFDPDGDGNPETDSKGCIKDYNLTPAVDPCTALNCGNSIYENLGSSGSEISLETGGNVSLRKARVQRLPTPSPMDNFKLDSRNLVSPYELVGIGSRTRKLVNGQASLNVSQLSSGDYRLYTWSCVSGNPPENCSWNAYNFTVT